MSSDGNDYPFHRWGDPNFDWEGLDAAGRYIGDWLCQYPRIPVRDIKEKFGTLRIYCSLGWYQFHDIMYPRYVYSRFPTWLWKLDCRYGYRFVALVNPLVTRIHIHAYRWRYRKAIKKWPHLRAEILCAADWPEYLRNL